HTGAKDGAKASLRARARAPAPPTSNRHSNKGSNNAKGSKGSKNEGLKGQAKSKAGTVRLGGPGGATVTLQRGARGEILLPQGAKITSPLGASADSLGSHKRFEVR
ncbi:hypothetical protein T484DRAFT_1847189, partial [Baffinella frigidus]